MVDQCLCHLCDCGKHVCPHDYRRMFKSASSQFSTLYKIKYPKHPLPIINNNSKKVYSPNKLPIDLLTTNRKDYVAYVIEPKKKDIPHSDHLKVKFAGKSFYQSEYPNWGPYRAEKVKILNLPYRGGEVKFNGSSSYQNDFRVLEEFNDLNIKITNRSLQKSSGVISPSTDFMGQTTFNRDFKPHNKRNIPKREKGLQHESRPTSTWTGQYSTTYRDTFTGTMNPLYQRKKGAQNAS